MKNILLLSILVLLSSCIKKKGSTKDDLSKLNKSNYNSPYEAYFNHIKVNKLPDTILVQNPIGILGDCGNEYTYREHIKLTPSEKTAPINKFYTKYGGILDRLEFFKLFEKNHHLKILLINLSRENEEFVYTLEDSLLRKNKKLAKRLISEKTYLTFTEVPKSLDSVTIHLSVYKPKSEKSISISVELSANKGKWKVDNEYKKELN